MKKQQEEAIKRLKSILKPGQIVYTVLRHTSKSGMCRWLDLYYIENDTPIRITVSASDATDHVYSRKKEALKVTGWGMDMGYHVVNCLSQCLYKKQNALTQRWI